MQFFKQTINSSFTAVASPAAVSVEDQSKSNRLSSASPKHSFRERGRTFNEPDAR